MTPSEVTALVDGFVRGQVSGKWDYRLGRPERDRDQWKVWVQWLPIGGGTFDTEPAIVCVSESDGGARWFDPETTTREAVRLMDS